MSVSKRLIAIATDSNTTVIFPLAVANNFTSYLFIILFFNIF